MLSFNINNCVWSIITISYSSIIINYIFYGHTCMIFPFLYVCLTPPDLSERIMHYLLQALMLLGLQPLWAKQDTPPLRRQISPGSHGKRIHGFCAEKKKKIIIVIH